ncbi:MAG: hypothetical protein HYZ49_19260 [Chloroflexi bacterium]|nr:hypothetical protein [Chloroflexota bacterium]
MTMPDTLSFSEIRARHADLLKAAPASGAGTPERLAEIRSFIEAARLAGRQVTDEDDREYLRGLLTFWGNTVYNQTRTYPNVNLELFAGKPGLKSVKPGEGVKAESTPPASGGNPVMWFVLAGLFLIVIVFVAVPVILSGLSGQAGPTAEPGASPATLTAIAEIGVPTFDSLGTPEPNSTPTLPGTGGGGGSVSPLSFISVQLIKPAFDEVVAVGQPVEIGGTYSNLQTGWRLFYVVTDFETGDSIILPESLPIDVDGSTGVWTATTALPRPGLYSVSVYIATSSSEIARLQAWADSAKAVTPSEEYDGVILFRDLSIFEAK